MRVDQLEGNDLDYWTARAWGIPADRVVIKSTFHAIDAAKFCHIVRDVEDEPGARIARPFLPSRNWEHGGPLHDQFKVGIERSGNMAALDKRVYAYVPGAELGGQFGPTALIAAARAIVASVYGTEVPDSQPQETP